MKGISKGQLIPAEDEGWAELRAALAGLPEDVMLEDGYLPEWSIKDLLAHLACWLAEGAQALQQMRLGTYREEELDVDQMNRTFWETCRDLDLESVWVMLHSSRARMLEELALLPEGRLDERAAALFRDNGADHYREHLPRLRDWLGELSAR